MSNVQPNIVATTEATVDAGFVKVFGAVDAISNELGGKWAKVARYVIKHNLTREIVLVSLKSMGKKQETAQSTTSRIMDLCKPENQWKLDKMEAGELSVRDARSSTISLDPTTGKIVRAPLVQRPASVRLADFLQSAANVAVTEKIDLATFIDKAHTAFAIASGPKAEKPTVVESSNVAGN